MTGNGREDEGGGVIPFQHRPARRQGNRPERFALGDEGRTLRRRIRPTGEDRLQTALAIPRRCGRPCAEEESGQQDQVHMPRMRNERLGQARYGLICGECYEHGEGDICMIEA